MCDLKNKAYLQEKVRQALERLYRYDFDLIKMKGVEWSISARIAMHLHTALSCHECLKGECRYRIDCEYWKRGNKKKKPPEDYEHRSMRPDITIHQRAGNHGDPTQGNILFCEVKKSAYDETDKQKVEYAISEDYKYFCGLLIYDIEVDGISVEWYCRSEGNENYNVERIDYCWTEKMLREKVRHDEVPV